MDGWRGGCMWERGRGNGSFRGRMRRCARVDKWPGAKADGAGVLDDGQGRPGRDEAAGNPEGPSGGCGSEGDERMAVRWSRGGVAGVIGVAAGGARRPGPGAHGQTRPIRRGPKAPGRAGNPRGQRRQRTWPPRNGERDDDRLREGSRREHGRRGRLDRAGWQDADERTLVPAGWYAATLVSLTSPRGRNGGGLRWAFDLGVVRDVEGLEVEAVVVGWTERVAAPGSRPWEWIGATGLDPACRPRLAELVGRRVQVEVGVEVRRGVPANVVRGLRFDGPGAGMASGRRGMTLAAPGGLPESDAEAGRRQATGERGSGSSPDDGG